MIRSKLLLAACVALTLFSERVAAQGIDVRLEGKVREGEGTPTLILLPQSKVRDLKVTLETNERPAIRVEAPELSAGSQFRIPIEAPLGTSHFVGRMQASLSDGRRINDGLEFDVHVIPSLTLTVPDERIDLAKHQLQLSMSRRARQCRYKVFFSGGRIDENVASFDSPPPGRWLTVRWRGCADCVVLKIQLFCEDQKGRQQAIELFPWWLEIPHEDVEFATGSATIEKEEEPKLEKAYQEIARGIVQYGEILDLRLFISGHTDTVGEAEHNEQLSVDRARALATFLQKQGVQVPIFYTGFGERMLAVSTGDNVDEHRNRRARYILAVAPPVEGEWRELEK